MTRPIPRLLPAVLLGATLLTTASGAAVMPHFALARSAPKKDATVPPPSEIRLWFTQVPQDNTVSIRLLDAARDPVKTGPVEQDDDDPKVFFTAVEATLPDGTYTVAWRGIGPDGHVVRGDFSFRVDASASPAWR